MSGSQREQDLYDLLGVRFDADQNEIKAAFRAKAKIFHPDANPNDVEGSAARFRSVKHAYDVLSDISKKAKYDVEWSLNRGFVHQSGSNPSECQVPEDDWSFACKYFPDLVEISDNLKKIAPEAEIQWKNQIFFERLFDKAIELAKLAEIAILAKIVGNSEVLREVARDALLTPSSKLYGELTKSIRIFGIPATEVMIVQILGEAVRDIDYPEEWNSLPVVREEVFGGRRIEIRSDLLCRVSLQSKYDPNHTIEERQYIHIFAARSAIDAGSI